VRPPLGGAPVGRRGFVAGALALLASLGLPRRSHGSDAPAGLPVVRISRASFPAERSAEVRRRLAASQQSLVPALRALPGCLDYFAGIDPASSTLVNVSVWRTLAEAKRLDDFEPMRKLASEFTQAGVVFERPVLNYETLWRL
jgi:hypothetical protein